MLCMVANTVTTEPVDIHFDWAQQVHSAQVIYSSIASSDTSFFRAATKFQQPEMKHADMLECCVSAHQVSPEDPRVWKATNGVLLSIINRRFDTPRWRPYRSSLESEKEAMLMLC